MDKLEDVDFLQKCLLLYRNVGKIVNTMVDANWSLTEIARCFDCMPYDEENEIYIFTYDCITCVLGRDENGKPFLQKDLDIAWQSDDEWTAKNFKVNELELGIAVKAEKQGIVTHDYARQITKESTPSYNRLILLNYIVQQEEKLWKK